MMDPIGRARAGGRAESPSLRRALPTADVAWTRSHQHPYHTCFSTYGFVGAFDGLQLPLFDRRRRFPGAETAGRRVFARARPVCRRTRLHLVSKSSLQGTGESMRSSVLLAGSYVPIYDRGRCVQVASPSN